MGSLAMIVGETELAAKKSMVVYKITMKEYFVMVNNLTIKRLYVFVLRAVDSQP